MKVGTFGKKKIHTFDPICDIINKDNPLPVYRRELYGGRNEAPIRYTQFSPSNEHTGRFFLVLDTTFDARFGNDTISFIRGTINKFQLN
jgi:hypothetical protein